MDGVLKGNGKELFIKVSICFCHFILFNNENIAATAPIHQHIQATPQVVPPYPIDARHPTPQAAMPPAPGFAPGGGYQAASYPPQPPYPTSTPYPTPGKSDM